MMGLMNLGALAVYLLVSIWVTKTAASWAKANNKKPWLWGGLAAFVMYNLVFWDLIPTLVMHKYYCDTQAGFWVYKTPEQWMRESPELTKEDLKTYGEQVDWNKFKWQFPYTPVINNSERYEYMINKRIYITGSSRENVSKILPIGKRMFYISDIKNEQKLAKIITFSSGYANPMTTGGIRGFKTWLRNTGCDSKAGDYTLAYIKFIEEIISLERTK